MAKFIFRCLAWARAQLPPITTPACAAPPPRIPRQRTATPTLWVTAHGIDIRPRREGIR
ncbi:hypothetical protein [Streptomyces cinnamoneus]|uniref:hypothetical protein n=1 Tax=Streptomyces cinnamoneus TaxID=53446 RepID=UPI0015E2E598|nr:hypothetical protein [Streptomyces cinnamoneus]